MSVIQLYVNLCLCNINVAMTNIQVGQFIISLHLKLSTECAFILMVRDK